MKEWLYFVPSFLKIEYQEMLFQGKLTIQFEREKYCTILDTQFCLFS